MIDFDGERLEDLFRRAVPVKSNPVRRVLLAAPFYIKTDLRSGHGFECELRSARRCAEAGIPAVEHLACGRDCSGSWLVTREWAGAVSAADWIANRIPTVDFLDNLADFTGKIIKSGLWHGDFHLGNVLYHPELREFALVDLRAVRRRYWFDRWHDYRMWRIGMELRRDLTDESMIGFYRRMGMRDPSGFFSRALKLEAVRLVREWPKRRAQLLHGYAKFSERRAEGLVRRGVTAADLSAAELLRGDPAELEHRFCGDFFLELGLIPRRRILGFDPAAGTAVLEVPGTTEPAGTAAADFRNRLKMLGFDSDFEEWRRTADGRIVYAGDSSRMDVSSGRI